MDAPGQREDAREPDAAEPALPKIVLTPTDGEEAATIWREATRPVFDTEPFGHQHPFQLSVHAYMIDGVIFNRTTFSASTFQRTAEHLRSSEQDFISVQLPLSGSELGHLHGDAHRMAPCQITIADWAHPFSTVARGVDQLAIMIPRSRAPWADQMYEKRPAIHWSLKSPAGRLFAGALKTMWQQLPGTNPDEAKLISHGLLGMLDGLVASAFDGPGVMDSQASADSMFRAMKAYLLEHLGDADLGPDRLATVFGCSRSTVYRLFQRENGVVAYLRRQRLQRCFDAIAAGQTSPRQLAYLRSRWAFNNASHFRRAFQDAFGISPREMANAIDLQLLSQQVPASKTKAIQRMIDEANRWLRT